MGSHSAPRSGAMTSVAGRGLFTATAAFALLGGTATMAFAGEAPSHSSHDEHAGHGDKHGDKHGHKHGEKHGDKHEDDCEIPFVDSSSEQLDATINSASGNATAQALEAGNEAIAPVHDAACGPARDILGGAPEAETPEAETQEAPETAQTGATPQAASQAPSITQLPVPTQS